MIRFSEIPPSDDMPSMPDEDKDLVMHVSLPILGGFRLMGSDAPESMGFRVNAGNNMYINLMPETRKETQKLFKALSEDGTVEQELQDMFWEIITEAAWIDLGCAGCLIVLKEQDNCNQVY
jgi:PhnB protein